MPYRISILLTIIVAKSVLSNDSFDESFNGDGDFDLGLDNPGWTIQGDGELRDGGYHWASGPFPDEGIDVIARSISQDGSFRHRIELRDVVLYPRRFDATADIWLEHFLSDKGFPDLGRVQFWINAEQEPGGVPGKWLLQAGGTNPDDDSGVEGYFSEFVEKGTNIALEMFYDNETSRLTFVFDNDIDDNEPGVMRGPYDYNGVVDDHEQASALIIRGALGGQTEGIVDNWEFTRPDLPRRGDFNDDGVLDVLDIDLLNNEVRNGTNDPAFDLGDDGIVDESDRVIWVHDLKKTYFGDANLDGEFNSSDFVAVFKGGEYEDDIDMNSGWAEGDWNGDGDFNTRDFVFAFQDGGYEQGPRVAAVVPEPSSVLLLLTALVLFAHHRPRR